MRLLKFYYVQHLLSAAPKYRRVERPKQNSFYNRAEFHSEPQQDQPTDSSREPTPPRPPAQHYLPPRPNFMKMSSLPLLSMSPPGAVISENFCMRLGCCAGVDTDGGCTPGAGTTAGPARRAGDAGAGGPDAGAVGAPGDCAVGVPALPALVRAIVLAGCPLAAPLPLACSPNSSHILHCRPHIPSHLFSDRSQSNFHYSVFVRFIMI